MILTPFLQGSHITATVPVVALSTSTQNSPWSNSASYLLVLRPPDSVIQVVRAAFEPSH